MLDVLNPRELTKPSGYSHGICAAGRLVFVAGQIGRKPDASGRDTIDAGFVDQFDQALANVLTVVRAAGGEPASVAKLTIFVTDASLYRSALKEIGVRYRSRMGRHFPAMTLVEVRALVDPRALVEIDGFAILRS